VAEIPCCISDNSYIEITQNARQCVCSCHNIAEILLKVALNTNQSIKLKWMC